MRSLPIVRLAFIALAFVTQTRSLTAEERYYVSVFASQGEPNLPRFAHTFAVFIKADGQGAFPKDYKMESHCISWLPASLQVQPLRLKPEPGKNLTLRETLKWAKDHKGRVTMWGPFPIKKELFERGVKRAQQLQAGDLEYVAIDKTFRAKGAINCIRAVADLTDGGPSLDTGTAYGDAASMLVVKHLSRWFLRPNGATDWIYECLEIDPAEVRPAP